jgi:hypothetical protein
VSAKDLRRARALTAEVRTRDSAQDALSHPDLLFGPQRAFVEDPSPFVVGCCTRRAGKTTALAIKATRTCHRFPGCTVFYITNTRRQAERGFWTQALLPVLRRLGIGYKLNQNELSVTFPNGSRILLGGMNDLQEIETYRGTKTPLVIIDEAQSVRGFISTLIDDIFVPQLADYGKHGQVLMTGTPNASCLGYFHDAVLGKNDNGGWSVHAWSFLQNPHMPEPRAWLTAYLARKGWSEKTPKIQREYFGQWVRDSEGLVYPLEALNLLQELPKGIRAPGGGWNYVLGIDPGFRDATAFVVLAFSEELAQIVVLESFQKAGLIPDAVAVEVELLCERYDFDSIVVDSGGLGKAYTETMVQKYGIPAEPAQKQQKNAAIAHLVGDLRAGVLRVFEPMNSDLIWDAALLSWDYEKVDRDARGGQVSWEDLKIDDRNPDHLCDAMLYAHRKCRAYMNTGAKEGPRPGTNAYWDEFEEDLWAGQVKKPVAWLDEESLPGFEDW